MNQCVWGHYTSCVYLIPWSRVLLKKLPVAQPLNAQYFMEPEDSLACAQEPVTGPYPEPEESSPYHSIPFKIYFNIILPSTSRSS
jgi:hypothetical protein